MLCFGFEPGFEISLQIVFVIHILLGDLESKMDLQILPKVSRRSRDKDFAKISSAYSLLYVYVK